MADDDVAGHRPYRHRQREWGAHNGGVAESRHQRLLAVCLTSHPADDGDDSERAEARRQCFVAAQVGATKREAGVNLPLESTGAQPGHQETDGEDQEEEEEGFAHAVGTVKNDHGMNGKQQRQNQTPGSRDRQIVQDAPGQVDGAAHGNSRNDVGREAELHQLREK